MKYTDPKSSDKMRLAMDVVTQMLIHYFPDGYIETVFSGMLDIDDVVEMIVFDVIKAIYDRTAEKHSMRYFFEKYGISQEADKMRYSRIQSYIMKYRKKEYEYRSDLHGINSEMEQLIPPDMSDMETKLEGYKLTEMNFFEITTILENEFTKAVTENRLLDLKKVKNEKFRDIIAQYDAVINGLADSWDKTVDDTIFKTMAAFTLEWKYPIHFLYSIVKRMEELEISEFSDEQLRLVTFCADVIGSSMLGAEFSAHSRMVTVRDRYIDLILNEPSESIDYLREHIRFGEGLFIVAQIRKNSNMTINGISIEDWFIENTTKEDWASFFRDYDIFEHISSEKKEWTNKRIRYFRRMYGKILQKPAGGD